MTCTQDRLLALIRDAASARVVNGSQLPGTQEFLLAWIYGLADAGAIDASMAFAAQSFIVSKQYTKAAKALVDLYDYPDDSFARVEGKSLKELEQAIGAYAPSAFLDAQANPAHPMHYVAKHYAFLTRAQRASMRCP